MAALATVGADDRPTNEWHKMSSIVPIHIGCCRAARPPVIDGKLDDPAWMKVPYTDRFVDIEGDKKPLPRFRTQMKLLWDDECLYIGADMEEPNVWATIDKRDAVIFHDNDFEIFIDPDGDNHNYFEFEINALGTGWDLLLDRPYRDGGKADTTWNIVGLRTAVHVNGTLNYTGDVDVGWSVELAIPWAALKSRAGCATPPRSGDQWRFNASRVQWQTEIVGGKTQKIKGRKEDNWVWSPQGVIDMHRPERWGIVEFVSAAAPPFELHPDTTLPIRDALHEVYYQAWTYYVRHKLWPENLEQFGPLSATAMRLPMRVELAPNRFRAWADFKRPDGSQETWEINQQSRIRRIATTPK